MTTKWKQHGMTTPLQSHDNDMSIIRQLLDNNIQQYEKDMKTTR
jgi:hypothetical protein